MGVGTSRFLGLLLEPHARLTGEEDRLGAKLLCSLMAVHALLALAGLVAVDEFLAQRLGHSVWASSSSVIILAGVTLILIAFVMVRLGYFRPGLVLYVLDTVAVALLAAFVGDPLGSVAMLTTVLFPIFVTTMLLSYRWVFGVVLVIVVCSVVLLRVVGLPEGQTETGAVLLGILVVASGLIVVLRHHFSVLERKRLDQLRQSQEEKLCLEVKIHQAARMESVGQLASGVAHDFNNLLTAILGNLELARGMLQEKDPLLESLEQVETAAKSAAALTQQLLAFTRQQVVDPKVVNLNDVIGRVHKMLTRMIGEDIALQNSAGKDLGSVKVDPSLMEQIVVNLVVNARDAMPDGGSLLLETSNVTLDASYQARHPLVAPGDYILLTVTDTGVGMTPEVLAHVFEPFFTTKPKGRGTGLGLAMVYGAVKQCGGHIEVYSEPGQGTTFKIYLPRSSERAQAREGQAQPVPVGSETILLVEDESVVRNLGVRILEKLGYRVLPAANGQEALRLAEQHRQPIHLLLTDVVMPNMNGRELSERISTLHPETKVLFTSGYCENIIMHRGVLDGGVAFIGKPYSLDELGAKIRQVLG
jgi:signal transduction histidine kinase